MLRQTTWQIHPIICSLRWRINTMIVLSHASNLLFWCLFHKTTFHTTHSYGRGAWTEICKQLVYVDHFPTTFCWQLMSFSHKNVRDCFAKTYSQGKSTSPTSQPNVVLSFQIFGNLFLLLWTKHFSHTSYHLPRIHYFWKEETPSPPTRLFLLLLETKFYHTVTAHCEKLLSLYPALPQTRELHNIVPHWIFQSVNL